MNKDIKKVLDMVGISDAIFNKIADDTDLPAACVYELFNQHQYSESTDPADFGYDDELAEDCFYRVSQEHDKSGITILGLGCYRIVFGFNGNAMKVDLPHKRGLSISENSEDYNIWQKIKKTSNRYLVSPITDSFYHKTIGRVNLFPIVERMDSDTYNIFESISFKYCECENTSDILEFVKHQDELTDIQKNQIICFMAGYFGFDDTHEGNWGFYEGRPVIIDFASFYPRFTGNQKIMKYIVSKICA